MHVYNELGSDLVARPSFGGRNLASPTLTYLTLERYDVVRATT
jgi:hypothetical protein